MHNSGNRALGSVIEIPITSSASDGSASAFSDALEVGDIVVYKNGIATARASTSGYTIVSSFDSKVGLNMLLIDTSDDSDAGFFVAGANYQVALDPNTETLDGKTVRAWIAEFGLESWYRDIDAPKINTALPNIPFYMVNNNGTPGTGLTVQAFRRLDGGSVEAASGSVAEDANGYYRFSADAADMNGVSVLHIFTATGARPTGVGYITKP